MRQAMQNVLQSVHVSANPPTPSAHPSTERERLLVSAWKLLGVPYQYGAKGPDKLDCSGFAKAAYEGIGIDLPDGSLRPEICFSIGGPATEVSALVAQ
jgi:cell wall-associated NlpC family hydrolase